MIRQLLVRICKTRGLAQKSFAYITYPPLRVIPLLRARGVLRRTHSPGRTEMKKRTACSAPFQLTPLRLSPISLSNCSSSLSYQLSTDPKVELLPISTKFYLEFDGNDQSKWHHFTKLKKTTSSLKK